MDPLMTLETFIGNASVVRELEIELEACRRRNVRPDHMLFTGHPGTGKTRLANTVANETGMHFLDVNSPMVKDLFSDVILELFVEPREEGEQENLLVYAPTIVFFDEAHELPSGVQNALLKIMLEGTTYKDGIHHDLRAITFIFATTDADGLIGPLKQRCELRFQLTRYTHNELATILTRFIVEDNGEKYQLTIHPQVAHYVAKRSRNTPRIGLQYMKRIYNHARARSNSANEAAQYMNLFVAKEFFQVRRISDDGLTPMDIQYLRTLYQSRRPMGISALAGLLEIDSKEVKEDLEPFLRYKNYIQFSKAGREITPLGIDVLRRFDGDEATKESLQQALQG